MRIEDICRNLGVERAGAPGFSGQRYAAMAVRQVQFEMQVGPFEKMKRTRKCPRCQIGPRGTLRWSKNGRYPCRNSSVWRQSQLQAGLLVSSYVAMMLRQRRWLNSGLTLDLIVLGAQQRDVVWAIEIASAKVACTSTFLTSTKQLDTVAGASF